jgi:hypothetical protein
MGMIDSRLYVRVFACTDKCLTVLVVGIVHVFVMVV